MTMADIAQTADEFLAERGYGPWGEALTDESTSIPSDRIVAVGGLSRLAFVADTTTLVADEDDDESDPWLPLHNVILHGPSRLAIEAAGMDERAWTRLVESRPIPRPRGIPVEGARDFVRRMGRMAERRSLPMMDGTDQGDYWEYNALTAPTSGARLVRWAERVYASRRAAGKRSAFKRRANTARKCGHVGAPTAQRVNGTWTCQTCRNADKAARSAARKRAASADQDRANALARIREADERRADEREALAAQRRAMAVGNGSVEFHA